MKNLSLAIFILFFFLTLGCDKNTSPEFEFKNIYDATLNVDQKISESIAIARKENKKILLLFGANWCPWCQRLHHLIETDEKIHRTVNKNYILILVDLGKRDRNMDIDARYGEPNKRGIPVFVVLETDGSYLATQETGSLEFPEGSNVKGHDPLKVMAFLKKWSSKI